MDLSERIMELSRSRYYCAEILAILMLETIGEENEGLVKAMKGLNAGIGHSGGNCGCLSGGCCILTYFGEAANPCVEKFVKWFSEELMTEYGSINCEDIIRGNPAKRVQICPLLIESAYTKCMELLEEEGLI